MKSLVVVIAIFGSSLFNKIPAKGNFSIGDKLEKAIKFEKK